ncbi:MAG: ERAP1-like C-terminal domain-containing protein, partial [Myxococcales bacterium]|nr:ERAP1-like C-terminal domain-containing protein [Myxococcales bacterium]
WLSDPQALDGELLDMVLPMAAWDGDAVLWTRLLDTLKANPDPVARVAIIGALASFEDPQLATRAFDLLLDGTLRAQDLRTVGGGITVRTRPAAWAWLTSHYDALVAVVGDTARPRLPWMGGGFCTTQERAQVATFFGAPEHAPEGTERNLGLVLEGIDRCIRLRASLHDPLATWLTNHAKGG